MILEDLEIKRDDSFSVSRQIADYFQENIRSNRLKPGQKLPKASELAKKVGVGNHTLNDAINILKTNGFIRTIPGKGTFVSETVELTEDSPALQTGNIAIISTFNKDSFGYQVSHPQTVDAIFASCWDLKLRAYVVSPHIDICDPRQLGAELKSGGFAGAIWLYPQQEAWPVIEQLRSDGINIVATTHYGNNYDIPAVQGNEAAAGAVVCDHMIEEGVEKIFLFWGGKSDADNAEKVITSTGHIGLKAGFSAVLHTKGLTEAVEIEDVVYSNVDHMHELLKKKIRNSPLKCGLIIPNNELFSSYFIENPDEFREIFADSCLVIGTSERQNNLLAPLEKVLPFKTLIAPFNAIGKSAVHKLTNIVEGKFENNVTMVPDIFGDFKII
jgi:GntR family transcriptional regulator